MNKIINKKCQNVDIVETNYYQNVRKIGLKYNIGTKVVGING